MFEELFFESLNGGAPVEGGTSDWIAVKAWAEELLAPNNTEESDEEQTGL